MSVSFEKIEENKVKLTVTVDALEFNGALDAAFTKVVKEVSIPGFRKGKVPRALFEKRFGVEALFEEAINYLVPKVYPTAVAEANIDPVAQPEIDFDYETIGKDKPFTFFATVVVKPVVKLGQYKGIEVTPLSEEVTDEDVQGEINKILDKQAELVVKETAAIDGDTVVIDYEGFKDEVPFDGGKASNHSLVLGSNSFIPGFEEKLIGVMAGEDRTIDLTFPEEYHSEELKGANVKFVVHCHEVKQRELPELTDELVKELNRENISTVAELKTDLKNSLVAQKQEAAKNYITDTVVEVASHNSEVNIPQEMIDAEADRMLHDVSHRLEDQGITLDLYLQYTGTTKEALLEQLKGDAAKRLRYNLTLEAIAIAEQIQPTPEDLEKEFEQMAKSYNVDVEQIKNAFPDTDYIEDNIKLRKAVDFLTDNCVKL